MTNWWTMDMQNMEPVIEAYPGQQQQVTSERAAVSHHGHDDEEAAHGDDDGVHGWRIREDGSFLQPDDTNTNRLCLISSSSSSSLR